MKKTIECNTADMASTKPGGKLQFGKGRGKFTKFKKRTESLNHKANHLVNRLLNEVDEFDTPMPPEGSDVDIDVYAGPGDDADISMGDGDSDLSTAEIAALNPVVLELSQQVQDLIIDAAVSGSVPADKMDAVEAYMRQSLILLLQGAEMSDDGSDGDVDVALPPEPVDTVGDTGSDELDEPPADESPADEPPVKAEKPAKSDDSDYDADDDNPKKKPPVGDSLARRSINFLQR